MATEFLFQALKTKTGNPLRQLILIHLADRTDDQGYCWPSMSRIASDCECDRSTVVRHVAALEDAGFLQRIRRSKGNIKTSNKYKLFSTDVAESNNDRCSTEPLGVVAENHQGSGTKQHKPISEPIKEPINSNKRLSFANIPDEYLEAMTEFAEHRVKKKSPLTQKALNRFMNNVVNSAAELQMHPNDVIHEAIDAGWQSVKTEWLRNRLGENNGQIQSGRNSKADGQSTRDTTLQENLTDRSWAKSH